MPPDPQFADLLTSPGCCIPATELRAISLDQLGLVMNHIIRRLTNEVWRVSKYENGQCFEVDLTDSKDVNLYDTCAKVICPATKERQLSLVEMMSEGPQPPDYFTSHWSVLYTAGLRVAHCASQVGRTNNANAGLSPSNESRSRTPREDDEA